jgi:hypothetical protein
LKTDNPGAEAPGFFAGQAELQAPQIQLWVEFRARKCKENQGKFLVFPWIPLVESGLFNGLRRIQIKKPPHAELASRIVLP